MHEHWLFVGNVFAHLVASMSGIVSFGIALYEAFKKKKFEGWAFFAIGSICLIVGFDQAWQDEHRNAEIVKAEKSSALSEREFWKQQSYSKDFSIQQRDTLLAQNYTALIGEQTTSNKTQQSLTKLADRMLDINKPPVQKFILRREDDSPKFEGFKHRSEFLVMTNLPMEAAFTVHCEHEINTLDARIFGGGPRFPDAFQQLDSRTWFVRIPSPQITAEHPLVVNIGFNQESLGVCSLTKQ